MYSNAYPSRASDYPDAEIPEPGFIEDESLLSLEEFERLQLAKSIENASVSAVAQSGQCPATTGYVSENLFEEDDAGVVGNGLANDQQLTIVGPDEIGGGQGLDEAEWAQLEPLDGKPWDGKSC